MAVRAMTGPATFSAGPWKGVRDTDDPLDDSPDYLVDAQNCYIPDPQGGSGLYARPGFNCRNYSSQLGGAGHRGQCLFTHVALDGTLTTFAIVSGKMYRLDPSWTAFTDVTPGGVTIDANDTTRVYATSFADQIILTDGVNRPWIASNLSSTPITGTYIDYDGAGGDWTAFGAPAVYGGALFFILNTVAGATARSTLAWSEINDPATGYTQSSYDNTWTLEQTSASALYAICATNIALYYFRANSIGAIAGAVGPNLSSTATHDAVSVNVGCIAPATVQLYGQTIFFIDRSARPQMLRPGAAPTPIWLNMRSALEDLGSSDLQETHLTASASAAIHPQLNVYLTTAWAQTSTGVVASPTIYAFDVLSGMYLGTWTIGTGAGVTVERMGVIQQNEGVTPVFAFIGSKAPVVNTVGQGGYVWLQSAPTDGSASNAWTDDTDGIASVPVITATTQRLGYSADRVLHADLATLITGNSAACTVTAVGTGTPSTLQGTPSPVASNDATYRLVCGLDAFGRGIELTVSPTTATNQWSLQRIDLRAAVALAGPDDA